MNRRKVGGWCAQYVVYTSEGRKRRTLYGNTRGEGAGKLSRALADREDGLVFDAGNRTASALRAYRKRQLEERMQKAGLWEDHGLVFPSEVGTSMGRRNLYRAFKIRAKRASLPQTLRFHDLRHSCAMKQGVNPKFVQELLGHANISLTLNTYSHVLPDMGDAAAGGMDATLG